MNLEEILQVEGEVDLYHYYLVTVIFDKGNFEKKKPALVF
jgi:hypothetical protein